MEGMVETALAVLEWAQRLGKIAAALAILTGGYFLMLGGDRGRPKAIGFFIGATVGLIVVMGAYGIAESIDNNIKF